MDPHVLDQWILDLIEKARGKAIGDDVADAMKERFEDLQMTEEAAS
jgi:hypothetical protein